ncbi:MAG TPA: hypothetical protein DEA90_11400 [Opitutae bacterium]|mgnify:FL=1|nr:hypothetical protein [Puniceicoccaceae bacterium]HBR94759.1 hypothetical protein [Opitutae bacterium]
MRQRLLLFLLEAAGDALSKMDLQKLLFLYNEETEAGHYETYRRFPYYAIHSEMRDRLLSTAEVDAVKNALPEPKNTIDPVLFTIGYEGIHFEEYINKLIRNRVAVLCDVRRNPLSRKFGFSSKMLSTVLPNLGIEYIHLPELGIASDKRKELNTMSDYETLFAGYRVELPTRTEGLKRLRTIIEKSKRVALTCFEAEPHCCHRHCISDLLEAQVGYKVTHL